MTACDDCRGLAPFTCVLHRPGSRVVAHDFETTSDARAAGVELSVGDVLVCRRERVIGIACAYPYAVTLLRGDLFELSLSLPRQRLVSARWDNGAQARGIERAIEIAGAMSFPTRTDDT